MPQTDSNIRYSETIPGNPTNWDWPARFDMQDGFLGITQAVVGSGNQRVLLSPEQIEALKLFLDGPSKA